MLRLLCLFYGNLVVDKRQLSFQKFTNFIKFLSNFSIPITCFKCFEKNKLYQANFIRLHNTWLAGFWQADGAFYAYGKFNRIHIILRAYITQRAKAAMLDQIYIAISGKKNFLNCFKWNNKNTI